MMKSLRHISLCLLLLASVYGCTRIPLHERSTKIDLLIKVEVDLDHDVNLSYDTTLDPELKGKIEGYIPEYHEVLFYDTVTHDLVTSQIVGSTGGQLYVPVGDYNMVIYGLGTKSTQVKDLYNRLQSDAFTTDITKAMADKFKAIQYNAPADSKASSKGYEDDPIIHEPDHLYVANVYDVNIPAFTGKDIVVTVKAGSSSIIDIYSLEVLNMKGAENIEKIDAFITGQVKSNYFGTPTRSEDPATLYVTLTPDAVNQRLWTVFGTFGKLPGNENKIYLDITVTDSGGGQYRYIYDVTDQFDDVNNTDNKLVIDGSDINIPKAESGGGGFNPSVDDWENEEIDVPLS